MDKVDDETVSNTAKEKEILSWSSLKERSRHDSDEVTYSEDR